MGQTRKVGFRIPPRAAAPTASGTKDALLGARYAGGMVTGRKRNRPKTARERELIAAIRHRAGQLTVRAKRRGETGMVTLGIGDDCAVLQPRRGEELVVTTDLSLENVHFRRDWHPPQSVGHRCLARGLSDLAAMGARPEAAFLSLALPAELTGPWLEGFFDGWMALAERHRVPLAGGDMAKSPSGMRQSQGLVVADIVLLGTVPKGRSLLRSGARPGDVIYVTGALGGSAAELLALERRPAAFRKSDVAGHPHLYPEPRLAVGRKLVRERFATAAIDLSDGLSTDLAHVCEASSLAAEIDAQALPVDARATLDQALHGGEDYELLFTAGPRTVVPSTLGGVSVHAIGRMKKRGRGPLVELIAGGKRSPLAAAGWEHFR
jgi:thiamine-monophosphate kinase